MQHIGPLYFHVVGKPNVGKTSLLKWLLDTDKIQSITNGHVPTFTIHESSLDEYKFGILSGPSFLILVYSVNDFSSFSWCMQAYRNNRIHWVNFPTLLIGTHCDVPFNERQVEISNAEAFAEENGLFFMEVSNIEETNLLLTRSILEIQLESYIERLNLESQSHPQDIQDFNTSQDRISPRRKKKLKHFSRSVIPPSITISPNNTLQSSPTSIMISKSSGQEDLTPSTNVPQPTPLSKWPNKPLNSKSKLKERVSTSKVKESDWISHRSIDSTPTMASKTQDDSTLYQASKESTSPFLNQLKSLSPERSFTSRILNFPTSSHQLLNISKSLESKNSFHKSPLSSNSKIQNTSKLPLSPASVYSNVSLKNTIYDSPRHSTPTNVKGTSQTNVSTYPTPSVSSPRITIPLSASSPSRPSNKTTPLTEEKRQLNSILSPSDDFLNDNGDIMLDDESPPSPHVSGSTDPSNKFLSDLHRHSFLLQNLKEIEDEVFASETIRSYQETRDGFVIPVISTTLKSSQASNIIYSRRRKNVLKEKEKIHIDIQVGDGRVAHIVVQDGDNIFELARKLQLAYRLSNRNQNDLAYLIKKAIRKHIAYKRKARRQIKEEQFVLETERRANAPRTVAPPLLKIEFERGSSKAGTIVVRKGSNTRQLAKNYVNMYGLKKSMIDVIANQIEEELYNHYSNEAKSLIQKMIPKNDSEETLDHVEESYVEEVSTVANRKILFNMEVEIATGKYCTFAVVEGDRPENLAEQFALKHNLSEKSKQKLYRLIIHHLRKFSPTNLK